MKQKQQSESFQRACIQSVVCILMCVHITAFIYFFVSFRCTCFQSSLLFRPYYPRSTNCSLLWSKLFSFFFSSFASSFVCCLYFHSVCFKDVKFYYRAIFFIAALHIHTLVLSLFHCHLWPVDVFVFPEKFFEMKKKTTTKKLMMKTKGKYIHVSLPCEWNM